MNDLKKRVSCEKVWTINSQRNSCIVYILKETVYPLPFSAMVLVWEAMMAKFPTSLKFCIFADVLIFFPLSSILLTWFIRLLKEMKQHWNTHMDMWKNLFVQRRNITGHGPKPYSMTIYYVPTTSIKSLSSCERWLDSQNPYQSLRSWPGIHDLVILLKSRGRNFIWAYLR